MKTIAVFGASGCSGKRFTELALKIEYAIKALVCDAPRLGTSKLEAIRGDILNLSDVKRTIDLTGPGKELPPELQRAATRNYRVNRLMVLGSLPSGLMLPLLCLVYG